MNSLKAILIASCILATGCRGVPHIIYVDSEFTSEERDIIDASIEEWFIATGSPIADIELIHDYHSPGPFKKNDYDTPESTIHKVNMSDPGLEDRIEERLEKGKDGDFYGQHLWQIKGAKQKSTIVLVEDVISQKCENYLRCFKNTFLHEAGHMFKLHHMESGLMKGGMNEGFISTASGWESPCIDKVSLDEFCEIHECVDPISTCGVIKNELHY